MLRLTVTGEQDLGIGEHCIPDEDEKTLEVQNFARFCLKKLLSTKTSTKNFFRGLSFQVLQLWVLQATCMLRRSALASGVYTWKPRMQRTVHSSNGGMPIFSNLQLWRCYDVQDFFFADKTQKLKEWCFRQVLLLFWNYKKSFSCFAKPFLFSFASQRMKGEEGYRRQTMTDSLYPYPESSLEHRHLLLPPRPPPLHMCKRETRGGGGGGAGYDTAALTFPSLHFVYIHWTYLGRKGREKPFS